MPTAPREPLRDRYLDSSGYDVVVESTRPDGSLLQEVRRRLQQASESHQNLAEQKEKLLVRRENVRAAGRKVHNQRVRAGDAEARFMSLLREFANEYGNSFSSHLFESYQEVQEERDRLGTMEEDYLQSERSLGGLEWTFIDQENEFYQYELQDMFSDDYLDQLSSKSAIKPPPTSASELEDVRSDIAFESDYRDALANLDQLKKNFNALKPEQAKYLDGMKDIKSPISEDLRDGEGYLKFHSHYSSLLDEIAEGEVKVQRSRERFMQHEALPSVIFRRKSDPGQLSTRNLPFDTMRKAQTEGAVPTLPQNLVVKNSISEWLLDRLKNNPMEKRTYSNFLALFGVEFSEHEYWEDRATQFWHNDMSEFTLGIPDEPPSVTRRTDQTPNEDTVPGSLEHHLSDQVHSQSRIKFDFDDNFNHGPAPQYENNKDEFDHMQTIIDTKTLAPTLSSSPRSIPGNAGQLPMLTIHPPDVSVSVRSVSTTDSPQSPSREGLIRSASTANLLEPHRPSRHDSAQASEISDSEHEGGRIRYALSIDRNENSFQSACSNKLTQALTGSGSEPGSRQGLPVSGDMEIATQESESHTPLFCLTPPKTSSILEKSQKAEGSTQGKHIPPNQDSESPETSFYSGAVSHLHLLLEATSPTRSRAVSDSGGHKKPKGDVLGCPYLSRRSRSISHLARIFRGDECVCHQTDIQQIDDHLFGEPNTR